MVLGVPLAAEESGDDSLQHSDLLGCEQVANVPWIMAGRGGSIINSGDESSCYGRGGGTDEGWVWCVRFWRILGGLFKGVMDFLDIENGDSFRRLFEGLREFLPVH